MRLLLDTHVWLWSLLDPHRIGPKMAKLLVDPEVELWLSPISVWEAHLLAERGRIQLDLPPAEWIKAALRRVPLREAPFTFAIAAASRAVPLPHSDPADRFLAATAESLGLTLATADELILSSPIRVVDCRV